MLKAFGGGVEEKGLSVGVHIWEPLAHSCRLSACLRMDLDGTGREGRGGRFAPADGNPDGSGRPPAQRAGRGRGGAVRAPFPGAGPQGRASHGPGLSYLPEAGAEAGEGPSDPSRRDLAVQPGRQWTQTRVPSRPGGSLCKAGGRPAGGLGALPVGLEAWEGGTSPSSGKSCGGTRGHFSDWERGVP